MNKGIKTTLIAVTLITVIFLSYPAFLFIAHDFNPDFMKIDSCLDRGGSWNYQSRQCEFKEETDIDISHLLKPEESDLDMFTDFTPIHGKDPRYIWSYTTSGDHSLAILKKQMEAEIDLTGALEGPIFTPLKDPIIFPNFPVDLELETVVWSNGADLAPEFLHELHNKQGQTTLKTRG